VVAALVKEGANLDAADTRGITALMRAAEIGDVQMVQFLLDQGATDTTGDLLHHAVKWDSRPVVEWLLQNGWSKDAVDSEGRTPVMVAASRDQPQLVQWLLEQGCASVAGPHARRAKECLAHPSVEKHWAAGYAPGLKRSRGSD
jgi:ankyrin repeat protein